MLERLIRAARSDRAADISPDEVSEYDWSVPHCLTRGQREQLKNLADQVAGGISAALGGLLDADVTLRGGDVTEHYASRLLEVDQDEAYAVVTDESSNVVGVVAMPMSIAAGSVVKLLGGSGDAAPSEREMTDLEQDLLVDVLEAATQSLSGAVLGNGGPALKCSPQLVTGRYRIPADEGAVYYRIPFVEQAHREEPCLAFILSGDVMEPVVFPERNAGVERTPEQTRRDLVDCVQHVVMDVRAGLWTSVPMGDILTLEPGDVVLLGRGPDTPISLSAGDLTLAQCLPVRCEGFYGIQLIRNESR